MIAKPHTAQARLDLSEPAECEDPRNALLPAVEAMLDAVVAQGLEAQLRAMVARKFGSGQQATGNRQPCAVVLANARSVIAQHGRRATTDVVKKQHQNLADALGALIGSEGDEA